MFFIKYLNFKVSLCIINAWHLLTNCFYSENLYWNWCFQSWIDFHKQLTTRQNRWNLIMIAERVGYTLPVNISSIHQLEYFTREICRARKILPPLLPQLKPTTRNILRRLVQGVHFTNIIFANITVFTRLRSPGI